MKDEKHQERVDDLETVEEYILTRHLIKYDLAKRYIKNKRVLDIACGCGDGSYILKTNGAKSVLGIDICKEAISYAKENFKIKGLNYAVLNAEKPFAKKINQKFDIIISFETLEHLVNHEQFINELKKMMGKGDTLILSTPNKTVCNIIKNKKLKNYHVKEVRRKELINLLKRDFYIKEILQARIIYPIPTLLKYKLLSLIPRNIKDYLKKRLIQQEIKEKQFKDSKERLIETNLSKPHYQYVPWKYESKFKGPMDIMVICTKK